jgi:Trypsin
MNLTIKFPILFVLCHFISAASIARVDHADVRDGRDSIPYLQKTAVYGDHDHRQTEEGYARSHAMSVEDLKNKISATGKIICDRFVGSANLVGNNRVIVTASHLLYQGGTCQKRAEAKDCIFMTRSGNQDGPAISIEKLVEAGYKCPSATTPGIGDDWAVMILKSPVGNASPYKLPGGADSSLVSGRSVVSVGALSDEYKTSNSIIFNKSHPKHMADCHIRQVHPLEPSIPQYFKSDCDAGNGSSGGGILSGNLEQPMLLGIISNNSKPTVKVGAPVKTGEVFKAIYDEEKWFQYDIPLDGPFLEAVKRALELTQ